MYDSKFYHGAKIQRTLFSLGIWQLLFIFLSVVVGLFFPVAGRFFVVIILLSSLSDQKGLRISSGILLAFFSAIIISSRAMGETPSDDFFYYYYSVYMDYARNSNDIERLFVFGDGLEVGLGILFFLIELVFGEVSPSLLVFIIVFLIYIFLLVVSEKYLLASISNKDKGLALALIFVFSSMVMASQVVRQFLSSIFVVAAFCAVTPKGKILFTLIAASFHLTSLPILLLMEGARKYPARTFMIIGVFGILIAFKLDQIYYFLSDLTQGDGSVGSSKLSYYDDKIGLSDNSSLLLVLNKALIALLFMLLSLKTAIALGFGRVFLAFIFVFIVFLPVPLASLRFTLVLNAVYFGYFVYILTPIKYVLLLRFLFLAYVLYGSFSLLRSDPLDPFRLWAVFPSYSSSPFYFLYYWL